MSLFALPVMARTVCTITLNSEHEKKIFTSRYKKEGVEFKELTDFKSSNDDKNWFDKACASGVKCDSLIISGHFGGTFFGEDTNLTLPLQTMERKACSKTCEGILSQPKEVYLFGCNTLADKAKDRRTPEQYREVLLNDGISEAYVDRIVAARYSPVGESFKSTMQKVFSGVPQIYGFDSIGPSGKTVSSFLKKYLDQIPNYSKRLDQLEAEKVMNQITKASDISSSYSDPWNSAMKGTAYAACSGAVDEQRKECILFDDKASKYEKMLTVESLLNSPDRKDHFLVVEEYLNGIDMKNLSADEKDVLSRIKSNTMAANELKAITPKLNSVLETKFPLVDLAGKVGWMSPDEVSKELEDTMKVAMKGKGLTNTKVQAFCSIRNPPDMSKFNAPAAWYQDSNFLTVVGCWQGTAGKTSLPTTVVSQLSRQLDSSDPDTAVEALGMVKSSVATDPALQKKVANLLYSNQISISASAMSVLGNVRNPSKEVVDVVAQGLNSSNPDVQKRSAFTIRNMGIQDPDLKRRALQIAPQMQPW
ncbi:HEAT repeat domain-containing protein [Bdellovibrio sp. HCB209]|uniref:HEAT repeat domain-containing protein n=1 Tax=Bdellovibrio sp. HCB209 TaxID=3394354 RepID=UPI0039B5753C